VLLAMKLFIKTKESDNNSCLNKKRTDADWVSAQVGVLTSVSHNQKNFWCK
jgi:hypothetical protein